MTTNAPNPDKTVAALIHLSTFSMFFFPLGNFIFPLVLWTAKKHDPFVDRHGKQALNFQISLFLYIIFLAFLAIAGAIMLVSNLAEGQSHFFMRDWDPFETPAEGLPILIYLLVMGLLVLGLFVLNLYAVISATIKAGEGQPYDYPLTINFISSANAEINQSKNEQFNNTQNETL